MYRLYLLTMFVAQHYQCRLECYPCGHGIQLVLPLIISERLQDWRMEHTNVHFLISLPYTNCPENISMFSKNVVFMPQFGCMHVLLSVIKSMTFVVSRISI